MPRTTPNEKIQTRAARSRLPQRRKPHWLCLRPGQLHLGYVRRNVDQAGHWTVRRYNGGGTYKVARLLPLLPVRRFEARRHGLSPLRGLISGVSLAGYLPT